MEPKMTSFKESEHEFLAMSTKRTQELPIIERLAFCNNVSQLQKLLENIDFFNLNINEMNAIFIKLTQYEFWKITQYYYDIIFQNGCYFLFFLVCVCFDIRHKKKMAKHKNINTNQKYVKYLFSFK